MTRRTPTAKPWNKSPYDISMTRVIRDPRDGTKDYFLRKDDAYAAFRAGKLAFDVTNDCYTEA